MQKLFKKSIELSYALYPAELGKKRCHHFSFVFNKNKLIAVGENKLNTTPRNRFNLTNFDISMKGTCSEMDVFIRAKNKYEKLEWKRLTLINCRIDRNGNIKNSRCCDSCQNLVKYLGIKNIYHTNDSGGFSQQVIN